MKSSDPDRKALGWFLALSFVPTWILWGLMWRLKISPQDHMGFAIFGTAGMYFPGIAALMARAFVSDDLRDTSITHLGHRRYYLWAWFLFPSLIAMAIAISCLAGAAHLDTTFSRLREMLREAHMQVPFHIGTFAVWQLVVAVVVLPPVHALTTIGEELGWRDFLLSRLMGIGLTQWTALIVTGAVWGIWHAPVILMGLEYVGYPYAGIPMFVVYAILVGVILGWLQLASGSVWVPAIAHGSINAVQRAALIFVTGYNPLIAGTFGSLAGLASLISFIAWLRWTRRLPVKSIGPLASEVEAREAVAR